jgi:hypothetical protein
MSTANVTVALPEALYRRLERTAQATKQPLEAVVLRAVSNGSPPAWDDVPPEFQVDLAALDKMDDAALWTIAKSRLDHGALARHDELLARNADGSLTPDECVELERLRHEQDLFTLRKAHAASLLRWRGHPIVSP